MANSALSEEEKKAAARKAIARARAAEAAAASKNPTTLVVGVSKGFSGRIEQMWDGDTYVYTLFAGDTVVRRAYNYEECTDEAARLGLVLEDPS